MSCSGAMRWSAGSTLRTRARTSRRGRACREPSGPGVRVDAGVSAGSDVSEHYDPLIAKLIIHAGSRGATITGMGRALRMYRILGVPTTIPFHRAMLQDPSFQKGRMWTTMAADLGILERLAGAAPRPEHGAR